MRLGVQPQAQVVAAGSWCSTVRGGCAGRGHDAAASVVWTQAQRVQLRLDGGIDIFIEQAHVCRVGLLAKGAELSAPEQDDLVSQLRDPSLAPDQLAFAGLKFAFGLG